MVFPRLPSRGAHPGILPIGPLDRIFSAGSLSQWHAPRGKLLRALLGASPSVILGEGCSASVWRELSGAIAQSTRRPLLGGLIFWANKPILRKRRLSLDNLQMIGRWLIIAGVTLAVVGGVIWLVGRIPGLNRLPGTIRIEGSGFTCLIPVLGSILLSIVLTLVLNLLIQIFRR